MPDELGERRDLQRLRELRARIEGLGMLVDLAIAAMEQDAQPGASERARRLGWRGIIGGGTIWAGAVGAAFARRAVREHPALTAMSAGIAVSTTAAALTLPIIGDRPRPGTAPRPSINAPAAQPPAPSPAPPEVRPEPRPTRPERPPRVITIPIRIEPPGLANRGGTPKVPPAVPERPPAPSEETPPPAAAAESPQAPTCLADVRVLVVSARLLCR